MLNQVKIIHLCILDSHSWHMVFFDLCVEAERTSYDQSIYVETGLVVFIITIGNWLDGLLRQFPDVEGFLDLIHKK